MPTMHRPRTGSTVSTAATDVCVNLVVLSVATVAKPQYPDNTLSRIKERKTNKASETIEDS